MNPTRTRQAAAAPPAGRRDGGRGTHRRTLRAPANEDGGMGGVGWSECGRDGGTSGMGNQRPPTYMAGSLLPCKGGDGEMGGTIDRTSTGRLIDKPRVTWTFSRKAR